MALPLAVSPGAGQVVKLRGTKLDEVQSVKVVGVDGLDALTIKKQEKVGLPPQVEAKEAGESELEAELAIPAGLSGSELGLVVETAAGRSQPYALRVLPAEELVAEIEPNDGFARSQALAPGKFIRGAIGGQRDVDVFRIEAGAGQTLTAEVFAARRGSVLDGWLGLFDAGGRMIASADDTDAGRDPLLAVAIPAAGNYSLVLLDAHDRGGATHPYLLHVKLAAP